MSRQVRLRLAAAVAVLVTTAALQSVVQGAAWFVQALLAVVVVSAAGAAASVLRVPAWLAVVGQLAALAVVVCVLYVPGQAVLGLLPGPQAVGALADLVTQARETVRNQAAPVVADPGFRLLTTTGAGVVAVVVDALAVGARTPALTGPVLLAVHAVAVVFAPGGLAWWWFALAVAGWVVLLAADGGSRAATWGRRVRQRGGAGDGTGGRARGGPGGGPGGGSGVGWPRGAAALTAVSAVVAAVVVPPLVPGTSSVFLVAGSSGLGGAAANSLNPLLDLRSDLGSQGTAEVLRYRTPDTTPSPLRIVTVDAFDGDVWQPSPLQPETTQSLDDGIPGTPGLAEGTPAQEVPYEITVEALRQRWLPVPYPPASVDVGGPWVVDTGTLNIQAQGRTSTEEGQTYTVVQRDVTPTAEQLRDAVPAPQEVLDRYTALPADLPPELRARALEVVGTAGTPSLQAAALQDWFRTDGGFTYSLRAPGPRSANALADFLVDRTGYCVHFASAMAVMARTLGIPARIGVGFLPGGSLGDGSWRVTLQDAHAWPELYFEGAGWVRFEPTPSARTGTAPAWTVAPVEPLQPSAAAPGATAPAAAPTTAAAPPAASSTAAAAPGGAAAQRGSPWPVLVVLAVVAGLLAAPLASRSLVRRRRWRRASGAGERAEAAWADLLEQVGDLGVSVPASETPRQVGRRLGDAGGGASQAPAVERLVGAVESARYGASDISGKGSGGSGGTALAEDVRVVVEAVVARRPRSATLRWRLLPPSGVGHLRRWGRSVRWAPPVRWRR